MASLGGMKAAAKRTAFGDVSNTANVNRPSRDDSVISGKVGFEVLEKAISLQQDKKATALLKPAQRPLSAAVKSLISNVTNVSTTGHAKPVLTDIALAPQPANTRKVLTKRNTTIFKDHPQTQTEQPVPQLEKPLPETESTNHIPHDLILQPSANEKSEEPQPKLRKTQSKYLADTKAHEAVPELPNVSSCLPEAMFRSDGAYIDEEGNIRLCEYVDETDSVEDQASQFDNGVRLPQELKEVPIVAHHDAARSTVLEQPKADKPQKHALTQVTEPEEYWEDDEENYDDDGYVTARSNRSRGDNTTGSATTVLLQPKANQKVKKELAAAKILVESTRTPEEIEDEAWDMSMVAEYGDEIFEYMRDLEVGNILV